MDVLELFRFIDWMMKLPDELEKSSERALSEFEGETMAYVTSIERNAMRRGIEKGNWPAGWDSFGRIFWKQST